MPEPGLVAPRSTPSLNPYGTTRVPGDNPGTLSGTGQAPGDCGTGGGAPPGQEPGTPQQDAGAATPGEDGQVIEKQQQVAATRRQALDPGLKNTISSGLKGTGTNFVSTSGGQPGPGGGPRTGSFRHNHGLATDGYFVDAKTGRVLNPSRPGADRTQVANALSSLKAAGIRGVGYGGTSGYMGQTNFHLDKHGFGGNVGVWGDNGKSANAEPWVKEAMGGPASQNPAQTGQGDPSAAQNSQQANCQQGSGGSGCQAASGGTPAAAASMAGGQGFNPSSLMQGGLASIAGGGLGGIQGLVQQALGGALGSAGGALGGLANVLGPGGFPGGDPASLISGLSQGGAGAIKNMAGNILPSLTGVIPSGLTDLVGSGFLTDKISGAASSILQAGVPNLGGFTSIFGSALGAATTGQDMKQALLGSASQVFGGVADVNNIPGLNFNGLLASGPTDAGDEGIEGLDGFTEAIKSNLGNTVNLIGPMDKVLPNLINAPNGVINGFSSSFKDYQSFATQGVGNLSDSVVDLGADLRRLGEMGDMTDLFNVGTPNQLARQIFEKGIGVRTGLTKKFEENGLNGTSLLDSSNNQKVREVLNSITDPAAISLVKQELKIDSSLNLENVGDLLNPQKVFPKSYQYNRFENINDMMLTFVICSQDGVGNIKSLGQLGDLFASLETVEFYTDLLNETNPIRPNEVYDVAQAIPVESKFNVAGPTIADFIGTAAGYVHADVLPRIAELQEEILNSGYFDDYALLLQLLADTLNGDYSDGSSLTVTVPNTAGYTFGVYSSLDNAVIAIVDAIETELQSQVDTLPDADPAVWQKVTELESLHYASAEFLHHEKKMRKAYGIDIGEPRVTDTFYGDGSTLTYPLSEPGGSNFEIFFDGVTRQTLVLNYTYDEASNSILFTNAPASGELVEIKYDVPRIKPEANISDIWQFASSLEGYGTQVGYGNAADYLRRITSNDVHGQRIQAIMIQARNKERFDSYGISCPGFNRVLNENGDDHNFNFIERTGIWSSDPARAAEIWLEQQTELRPDQYYGNRISENWAYVERDSKQMCQNYMRQMLYLTTDNQIAMTELFAYIYSINKDYYGDLYTVDMDLLLRDTFPSDGYVIGPYKEVISEILRIEQVVDEIFNVPLSDNTKTYLDQINTDINDIVGVAQRTMLYNLSVFYGLSEQEVREVLGMPGVGYYLLQNIADKI